MIHDASTLQLPLRLTADLVVIGSGPGGSSVARIAAEAGMKVVVLEGGEFLTPADMDQREESMLPRLFQEGGNQVTADKRIRVHQGRGVGGSSLHNLNLCKRVPDEILAEWKRDRGLDVIDWEARYAEAEALISVSAVPLDRVNRHNTILRAGAEALGWRNGPLRHNRTGCVGSGFCELGCAFDAKNNALKVNIPRAVKAGATILARCQATRVLHENGRVTGVEAVAVDPVQRVGIGRVEIVAPRVCLSASATGTPALLQRSDVPDPGGEAGRTLRIHPAIVVAGDFAEPVRAWEGIPQTWECTEHLDFAGGHRLWIVPAFAHPVGTATLIPGLGADHRASMERYPNLAVLTAMLHDRSVGSVRPKGELGVSIHYQLDEADEAELRFGIVASARLLFAAGATRVMVPGRKLVALDDPARVEELLQVEGADVTAVHPMASVPMGADPTIAAVGPDGRHHHLDGLWIADASLFPTSIGVPPQLSVYALGLHVGHAIVG